MTHRAEYYIKTAPLSSDFAREFLGRRYGEALTSEIYAALPKFTRGPRKGLVKGFVRWIKCTKGGWMRTGPSYYGTPTGQVLTPGTHRVEVMLSLEAETYHVFSPTALASSLTHEQLVNAFRRTIGLEVAA